MDCRERTIPHSARLTLTVMVLLRDRMVHLCRFIMIFCIFDYLGSVIPYKAEKFLYLKNGKVIFFDNQTGHSGITRVSVSINMLSGVCEKKTKGS